MANRLSIDRYYLEILDLVAARSTCARRAVGAILTTEDNKILSTGYNGVPSGMPHCTEIPCPGAADPKGDTTRCHAVHAEQNAIMQCWRLDLAHNLYVTCTPCFVCTRMIANTPIRRIICREEYADQLGRWILLEKDITVDVYPRQT